jgi:hypothetical protein
MSTMKANIFEAIHEAFDATSLDWASACDHAEEVILFGSRAAGCADPLNSDVDLLFVGDGKRVRTANLDVVWIHAAATRDPQWLSSELCGHVSRYGVWLKGTRSFQFTPPSSETVSRKFQRIRQRADMLSSRWASLSDGFKTDTVRKLRLDIQRLAILNDQQAVAPTPELERRWTCIASPEDWLREVLGGTPTIFDVVRHVLLNLSATANAALP